MNVLEIQCAKVKLKAGTGTNRPWHFPFLRVNRLQIWCRKRCLTFWSTALREGKSLSCFSSSFTLLRDSLYICMCMSRECSMFLKIVPSHCLNWPCWSINTAGSHACTFPRLQFSRHESSLLCISSMTFKKKNLWVNVLVYLIQFILKSFFFFFLQTQS